MHHQSLATASSIGALYQPEGIGQQSGQSDPPFRHEQTRCLHRHQNLNQLAPLTHATIERHMAVINSYYSNLIECKARQRIERYVQARNDNAPHAGCWAS